MSVEFDAIERQFGEIFGFIQQDLSRIVQLEPGVNYVAAALITCACEAMAKYRYGTGEGADVFAKLLPGGVYQVVAKTLYNALRNGLVHGYDAQDIQFNGSRLGLGIAWQGTPHLSIVHKGGKPYLVLNVRELSERLSEQIDLYCAELKAEASARDRFLKQNKKDRVEIAGTSEETLAWRKLIHASP